jgi:hypothetical protein
LLVMGSPHYVPELTPKPSHAARFQNAATTRYVRAWWNHNLHKGVASVAADFNLAGANTRRTLTSRTSMRRETVIEAFRSHAYLRVV